MQGRGCVSLHPSPRNNIYSIDLLPYYAILRSIPNKLLGVLAMFASLFILLAMPLLDTSRLRGSQFRPIMKFMFWVFVSNFFILM
jgi:ubiquinol-cytochrome c reductase cytochrome b subunit